MKMTMHIDEALLADVMASTGARTKTEAVRLALEQTSRRARFKRLASTMWSHLTPAQLKNMIIDPPDESARVAETPPKRGSKRTAR
jgi:Arc/MetJ family transcription regulator